MDLVQKIQKEEPTLTIEELLEKVRIATLQNVLKEVKGYASPLHLVRDLCRRDLTLEDVRTVLEWVAEKDVEVRRFTQMGAIEYTYELMSMDRSPSCFPCWQRRPGTSNTKSTDRQS